MSGPLLLSGDVVENLAIKDRPILGLVLYLFVCPVAQPLSHLLQRGVSISMDIRSADGWASALPHGCDGSWDLQPAGAQAVNVRSSSVLVSQSLVGATGACA
jgi:hypothetical protein